MEISLENLYVDTGALRVKRDFLGNYIFLRAIIAVSRELDCYINYSCFPSVFNYCFEYFGSYMYM